MEQLKAIWRFTSPYLRPYWKRAVAGVLLGIFFGLSNAGVLWATKTMLESLTPTQERATAVGDSKSGVQSEATSQGLPPSQLLGLDTPELQKGETNGSPETASPQKSGETAGEVGWISWLKQKRNALETKVNRTVSRFLPTIGDPVTARQAIGALLFLPGMLAIRGFSSYFATYCLAWASERVVNDVRVDVLNRLSRLSLDYFDRSKLGDMITRINRDTDALQQCLSRGVNQFVKSPATLISVFIGLCLIDWQLTLSTLILLPLCVTPVAILGKKARRANREVVNTHVTQASLMVEMLSSIRIVKAFNLETTQVERFRRLSRNLVRHILKTVRAKNLTGPIIEVVSGIGIGALILFVAATNRSIPQLVAFFMGLVMFYEPIKKLAKLHVIIEKASVGVQRLIQILNEEPTVREHSSPQRCDSFNTALTFEHISFAYGNEPVLHNVSFTVPKGYKLGIAGESGSGKSTLVNLTFRFYDPTEGTIRLDGSDIRELAIRDLRAQMALVSQEVVLFDQSVRNNIACGKTDASFEEIEAAARAAFAHEFISNLPQGYDSPVGERGVTLSGGQRQRISIARAFVRDAPILVLDEATAALDSQSEAQVQRAIDRLTTNRTVICVAHRLSTLQRMDGIIVLSRGEVIERGTFSELLRAQGTFATMAESQGIVSPVSR